MPSYHPTVNDCITQWHHNRKLLSNLNPEFNDWIITATFYALLHAVEALLIADGIIDNHETHGKRATLLQHNAQYKKAVWPLYKVAYDLAHVSRYSARPHRWAGANIATILFDRSFYPLEKVVVDALAKATPRPICPPCPPITLAK